MTLEFNKTDVNVEALPVVSEFLNNEKRGIEVVEIIEHDGKQAVNARSCTKSWAVSKTFQHGLKIA